MAERFAGVAKLGDTQWSAFIGEARRISTLASSNVARVRELAVRGDDLVAFWDFIDGEKLSETWLSRMPLEVSLRIVLDVLSGVSAIHGIRDTKQQSMEIAHGEVSAATIVVGLDGVGRLLHAIARRLPRARAEAASLGYLAPEVHAGEPYDARADVFSAGVLLWEAVSAKRLFFEGDAAAIAARVRRHGVPLASVPAGAGWAAPLVAVAARALAPLPCDRWPTAAAMAAEIRKAVGLKLASAAAAASFARAAMGERTKVRRQELESGDALVTASLPAENASDAPRALNASHTMPTESTAPLAPESLAPESIDSLPEQLPPPLPQRTSPQRLSSARVGPHAQVDDANATHDFAAAIDVPLSISPPPPAAIAVSHASIAPAGPFDDNGGVTRRRRVAVLGGVGAFGMIVFVLAGWRVAHRDPGVGLPAGEPTRVVAGSASPPAWPPMASPARADVTAPAPPASSVGAPAPTSGAAASASPTPPSPPLVNSAPVLKPSSMATAAQRPPAPTQALRRHHSNSGYDPGSL